MRHRLAVALVALLAVAAPAAAAAAAQGPALPTLIVEAPPALAQLAERVRSFDRARLVTAMELVGLSDPGPPILLLLAPDGSELARQAPGWAAGYASGARGVAVILPSRIPNYPYRSLEAVIQHEVAHVLVARASGGRPVPRWFNEGVAMAAARAWTLDDRTQLFLGAVTWGPDSLAELDAAFSYGSAADARAAYAESSALVRELQRRGGEGATGAILRRMAAGAPFADAFEAAVGVSLVEFEEAFWRRHLLWLRWVPIVSSSATLWIAITLLALVAFRRRRQRDAELARRWEEEEALQRRALAPREPPDELVN